MLVSRIEGAYPVGLEASYPRAMWVVHVDVGVISFPWDDYVTSGRLDISIWVAGHCINRDMLKVTRVAGTQSRGGGGSHRPCLCALERWVSNEVGGGLAVI